MCYARKVISRAGEIIRPASTCVDDRFIWGPNLMP